jgi:pimeloyl-ACP methyl ester carboxylesterase
LSEAELQFLDVGSGVDKRRIVFRRRQGAGPGLIWLPGFKSDMASTKARGLDEYCEAKGRALLRFDYSGHGLSSGRFEDGTISRWLEEAISIFHAATAGPQIVIGSSMGGYLALLLARSLSASKSIASLAGLVLIAPAVDFTEILIWGKAGAEVRETIMRIGHWLRPTPYSLEPYPITRGLIEDGRRHLIMGGAIRTYAPTWILQGMLDEDVPCAHVKSLAENITNDPIILTLVSDGDHRLSRPQDLQLLISAIESAVHTASAVVATDGPGPGRRQ